MSDIIILNSKNIPNANKTEIRKFIRKIYDKYIILIEGLRSGQRNADTYPSTDETCMTIAYSFSKMSSCLKRKVGSVIIDKITAKKSEQKATERNGDSSERVKEIPFIVSSGYNEVPIGSYKCIFNPEYQMCYRDYLQELHAKNISHCPNCGEKIQLKIECPHCHEMHDGFIKFCRSSLKEIEDDYICPNCNVPVFKKFLPGGKDSAGKLLDMCRALHAEENALLNLVKSGNSSNEHLTLYVTTQPCNLCANKIAAAGIKKVVFDEPYAMKESIEILENANISTVRFEGVKSSAYFRLY